MARTDIHRPAAIEPTEYDFVGFQYLRCDGLGDAMFLQSERQRIQAHRERTGATNSDHEHGGNCDICGSVNAIYKALFWHRPTNTYISTGLDCAEKLDCEEVDSFRRSVRSALDQKAGKRKAQAELELAGLGKAWEIYAAAGADRKYEEATISDIVAKLVQYGSLSDKQLAFVGSLLVKIDNRAAIEAKRAEEMAAAAPVPVSDKRMTVTGIIRSIKVPNYDRDDFGPTRILVQHVDGWKVYGSLPSNLRDIKVGETVKFDASVKASDKDAKFGFFSRPTKAQRVL